MLDRNTIHESDIFDLCGRLDPQSVDMILCDLPYGEINHNERLHERAKYANGPIRQLYKGAADDCTLDIAAICAAFDRIARGWIYTFCGTQQAGIIREYFSERGCMTRHCIWEKSNPSPLHGQYIWLSSVENCIVARKSYAPYNEFCHSAVWRFPAGTSERHPTEKPVRLFEYLIRSSTRPGELVCDPCVGSGTTALAARNTGRDYIVGDSSPEYVAIARRRLDAPYTLPLIPEAPEREVYETLPLDLSE